ncbi:response regulator [Desulfobulbus rhabdoformis]|uniref:ATP-binding protein n=1 Tax=Desulfobulbus rhabdoformis TaxID=34032 RepID=UPI001962A0BB|nr:ATP-binding protein [Desulfobulbus rhabdoformis]MBM9615877.1 response regulator [Desulfobulbus rhabdoformis]
MLALILSCLLGFAGFIYLHQEYLYQQAVDRLHNHAAVVANSLWTYEKKSPSAYLRLAAQSNGYLSVVLLDAPEHEFLRIQGPSLSFTGRLLHKVHLIPIERIEHPITFEGQLIGSIVALWPNQAVYFYLYIFWSLLLFFLVFWLFLKLLDAKRTLEHKVYKRTLELENEVATRVQAEETARRQAKRLAIHAQHTPLGVIEWDLDFKIVEWNLAAQEIFGFSREEALGKAAVDLLLSDADIPAVEHIWQQLLNNTGGTRSINSNLTKSGATKICEWYNTPLTDSQGNVFGAASLVLDCTEKLETDAENRRLQSQLLQVQKMEAIGQLAGGVAHDFNNMLGVILGQSELAMMRTKPDTPFYRNLVEIRKAAERSAQITSQLLAFARKQTLSTKVLHLNELIEGMLKMVQRLIGEGVELRWIPGDDLWPIQADPAQIDQILVNLCVNSRDAMQSGVGRITVETNNRILEEEYCSHHPGAVPGEYASLTISDTGCGMNKETLGHIFEPFFTTKGVGEGTGLGMATVYGSIKQHKGFIDVVSEPGRGTTVTIYLPRVQQSLQARGGDELREQLAGGLETILVVEDDSAVLDMTTSMLQHLGYTVIPANGPTAAIELIQQQATKIDLLLTDVIMPEMNGLDLLNILKKSQPQLNWLFTSGYTGNVIAQHGILEKDTPFIQKPFTTAQLAKAVQKALHPEKGEIILSP